MISVMTYKFPCWVGVDVDQDGVGGDKIVDVGKRGNAFFRAKER